MCQPAARQVGSFSGLCSHVEAVPNPGPVQVGDRPTWKNPAHPFRHDTSLKLSGIPTLMHWTENGPSSRIDSHLEGAPHPDAAADLIAAFIKSVKELDSVANVKLNTF